MNAQKAKQLADDFHGRSESQAILDHIERAAKSGCYEIVTGNMDSIVASSLKYALKGMGYKVQKCKSNVLSHSQDDFCLKIQWIDTSI